MEKETGLHNNQYDSSHHDVSFSDEISTTTLVKLLVRKGILTTKEVLEEERLTRLQHQIVDANIEHPLSHKHGKQSRLKKWASKHKWSRRVTGKLFGWEWKRNKHKSSSRYE